LESEAKLDGVLTFVYERIVVCLERVPVVVIGRVPADTARERSDTSDRHLGCPNLARHGSQCWIGRSRIKGFEALIIGDFFMPKAKANSVCKCGSENMRFLCDKILSRCFRRQQNVAEAIGRRVGGLIKDVGTKK